MMIRHQQWRLLLVCVLALAVVSAFAAAAAPATEPRSVVEFFLLVPETYLPYDADFRHELLDGEHRGTVVDLPNGYISWDASDAPDSFEFAIFRKTNGAYIVAYNDTGDDFDEPQERGNLLLLSYERGTWRDVTRTLLPVTVDQHARFRLPRHGRDIEVSDADGKAEFELTWTNDRFQMKRGDRTIPDAH